MPNPPNNLVEELQKTVLQFVWNRKQDRISRETAVRTIAKAGLGLPDIRNRRGPRTEPCGTPAGTFFRSDLSPLITVACI